MHNRIDVQNDPVNFVDPLGLIEGVYETTDAKTGLPYTGQSSDVEARIKTHINSGKVDPNSDVTVTEVSGGKTNREIVEYQKIQQKTNNVPARNSSLVPTK